MNVYSDPEKFDLKIAFEADAGESYTFDKLVIWRKRDGSLVMKTDSG